MASIKLRGDTSGEITIQAPAVAGTTTLNLPATSSTLATTAQTEAVYNSLGVRNLIINGDMRIAQRGTSATTGNEYLIDRWKQVRVLSSATVEMSQSTDVPTAQGFYNSIKLNVTSAGALSAGNYHRIDQRIEGQNLQHIKWGTASPEKLTLSFWVKSNYTGGFVATLNPANGATNSISFTVNSVDTWEKKTLTFTDTTSTAPIPNDNNSGLQLYFYNAVGSSTFTETLNNYINITGVQLEVGDTATPFEHRPYDMELARCKRYYERITAPNSYTRFAVGQCVASTQGKTLLHFTEKRAVPSIAFTTASLYMVGANTGGGLLCTAITSEQPSYKTVGIVANVSSGLSAGNATYVAANNTTSAYIEISSEL